MWGLSLQKRYPFAALAVLASTAVAPIAEVHWTTTHFFPHYELYFAWGTYNLLYHYIRTYWSGTTNHYLTLGLPYLVALWVVLGAVLSVIILYSSRTSHRPRVAWAVVASVLVSQIILPFPVFGALSGRVFWERHAYTTYILPLPFPSVLAILALVVLRQMRRQPANSNVGSEHASTC